MTAPDDPPDPASLRWLSRDYALLREQARAGVRFDAVIVGSGYGGAMAAAELAGRVGPDGQPLRICVLERGREYAPGMFASALQELPTHVRLHRASRGRTLGARDALLDVRVGPDVCAIVGNGLGGTSLVNAGVMEKPRLAASGLPPQVVRDLDDAFLEEVKARLGASDALAREHPDLAGEPLAKTAALQRLAQRCDLPFRPAAITVQTAPDAAPHARCTLCGDCMTGCNVGAKRSLDTTLLAQAWRRGVEIYTGGCVLQVTRATDGGWLLRTVFTDAGLRRRHAPQDLRAGRVILAAGTLGSTEILLRSRAAGLRLSHRLGSRFSCNGDNLVALHGGPRPVHATDAESRPLHRRRVGPTITGVLDLGDLLVQEFAVPAPLQRLFGEAVTTARLLNQLSSWPRRSATQRAAGLDSMAVDPQAMEHTLLLGLIGHDESEGDIVLPPAGPGADPLAEGEAAIRWPGIRRSPRMEQAHERVARLFADGGEGAAVLPNPLWRLLPTDMDFLVGGERGPVLTVHPLGGCGMGADATQGVVDDLGRVFLPQDHAGAPPAHHPGLVVLDGAILPQSLGANPALTIAALACRATRRLAQDWGWRTPAQAAPRPLPRRPVLRPPAACTPARPRATQIELVERLAGGFEGWWLELTLTFGPLDVNELAQPARRLLRVDPRRSRARLYARAPGASPGEWQDLRRELMLCSEAERDARAASIVALDGTLQLLEPEGDFFTAVDGMVRATGAWLVNRGLRELWDLCFDASKHARVMSLAKLLASGARAGEMRLFDYRLVVGAPVDPARPPPPGLLAAGSELRGGKCLTYGLRANPWRQLTTLRLRGFPRPGAEGLLRLDGRFMAGQGIPLLRITGQENQVTALADIVALALAWVRTLASIHLWSFRAPDPAPPREPQRLPGPLRGLPPPEVEELPLEAAASHPAVRVRLTRYRNGGRPVALVHGYSASGSTFTHEAIPRPLARHLWEAGRDVWVLDLRTSAGMPTARLPWRFEDAALADLPVAIAHIHARRGQPVDVVAHCIGAVMLSMALLADGATLARYEAVETPWGLPRPTRYPRELALLKARIRRIVLFQKGPLVVYSDDNVLRAYLLRALRHLVFPHDYQFRVPARPGLAANLLDRVLATLPYPEDEFRRENPWQPWRRAPWAGFRHRMDALYARDFSLANMADDTLAAIEDLFGPLNLDTVAQAIHFARQNAITDGAGVRVDTHRALLRRRWPRGGTLSVHGVDNGLADLRTLALLREHMAFAGVPYETEAIAGHGHQDCLVGVHAAHKVFPRVLRFLDAP